jgi:CRISPR-associated protein Csb2
MLVLELRFPACRYHATPWGRHVNEGALDWPPSPWRILRALLATWHWKAKADVPETVLRALISSLAAQPPVYQLPPASAGHTRHYMPIIEGKSQKTTKVFDTFLHLAGPLRIAWDVTLTDEQLRALDMLGRRLGYFGRAESLVEARLETAGDFKPNARPLADTEPLPADAELVRLLVPLSPTEYAAWRSTQAASAESAPAQPKPRGRKKAASPTLPADLFEALHANTANLQAVGWALPPGSWFMDYVRPANCLAVTPERARRHVGAPPTLARFTVSSAVLPRITHAVSVAERIHQALLARFPNGNPPSVLSGRDAEGKPLAGHQHLHIFCEPNGPRDAVTHVTLYARQGFDAAARRAFESLQKVWGHGGHDLQLVLLGFGDESAFADCSLFRRAAVWRSLTPFVPTRHPKTHRDGRPKLDADGWWIGSAEHDLRRLIAEAGLPIPVKLERLATIPVGPRRLRPVEFQTQRYHGEGRRAQTAGAAFQLTFSEPVSGPLAFGYGAHFGLGLFVPAGQTMP